MTTQTSAPPGVSTGLTLLFAVASGIAVGNLYWSQPLLVTIANDLGVTPGRAGFLVTLTQIGYAIGILLIVPLGDILSRRRLLPLTMIAAAIALAAAAIAPGFSALLVALLCVGLLTTGGQIIAPLAGDLAKPDQRGRVVGTIASGMLTGILLSRVISGVLADLLGWRSVYALAAAATLAMAPLLRRAVPPDQRRTPVPYSHLLRSIFDVVWDQVAVRATLVIGATAFAVFTLFWTGLTFLLTQPPFGYSLSQIGLVGIAGIAGALAARRAGNLHDRGLGVPAQGLALMFSALALLIAWVGATSILMMIIAIVMLDAAIQSVNVLNQIRLLNVNPQARSRMNSAFVTSNFVGGAIGSALASIVWPLANWDGLILCALALIAVAFVVWTLWRPELLRSGTP